MGATRKPTRRKYGACEGCECNISGYGKCLKNYDNFYYRISKNNGCEKCEEFKKNKRISGIINAFM